MKELFEKLEKITLDTGHDLVLLDTCFLIHTFEHQKEHELLDLVENHNVAISSFNVQEFLLKEHVVDERVREQARRFLKKGPNLKVLDINVFPGNREQEKMFVNAIDSSLLKEVPDASDAVLIAAAIRTGSTVLTKDKHHLFTTKLENYLQKYNIEVYKEYRDILK